ncbi:hypothetical protein BAY59_24240 [Prauserella coralliicola]|nr:hypothetical protein BAY59_24240 [Prauserella coralliicola]
MSRPRYPLDHNTYRYVWSQLAEHLLSRIQAGEFDHRLPRHETLADEYGVTVATVRRAVRDLAERGLVVTVPGKGTYLA